MVSALTVEELLAELPAKDSGHAAQLYEQLAAGDETVIIALCDRVSLWTQDADPKTPMALHGLANYVMRPGHGANRSKVARLYEAALGKAGDLNIKRFFMELLRVCGDDQTVAIVAEYLCDADLYEDAIITLEAIGGDETLKVLKLKRCPRMPKGHAVAVRTALTRMCDKVILDKEAPKLDKRVRAAAATPPEPAEAERIAALCRKALNNTKLQPHVRAFALWVLVSIIGEAALPDMITAAETNEPTLWGMAMQLSETLPGIEVSKTWIRRFDYLPEPVRPQVIYMLGGRNDISAKAAIRRMLNSEQGDLLLAACDAVGRYEDKEGFMQSLEAAMFAAKSPKEVDAVKAAMMQFPEPGLSEVAARRALHGGLLQRVAYLNILASRHAEQHLRSVRKCLEDETPEVRRAALNALAVIGNQEDMDAVFEHLLAEEADGEANAAREALAAIADKRQIRPVALERIVNAFTNAGLDKQMRLLKTLGALGDKEALAEVGKIAETTLFGEGRNMDLGNAALETLGTWQDVRACDLLLNLLGRMETPEMRQAVVIQIIIAAPRVYSNPDNQIEFLEKAKAMLTEEAEQELLTAAIEKAQIEKKK